MLDEYMPAYKIGSGDVTWLEALEASLKQTYFLATGASEMWEVEKAVQAIVKVNPRICIMQCNTNYTGSLENLGYVQLNAKNLREKVSWCGSGFK
jgi:N-acetylneuraminate synthase